MSAKTQKNGSGETKNAEIASLDFKIRKIAKDTHETPRQRLARRGSISAACYVLNNRNNSKAASQDSRHAHAILAGAALLLASIWLVDKDRPYPGVWALLPTLGTALLLFGGKKDAVGRPSIIGNILTSQFMQAAGRVSYGWYLWHWPLLILAPLLLPFNGAWGNTVAVLASLSLAVMSYFWIEQPLRKNNQLLRWPRAMNAVAVMLMILTSASMFAWGAHAERQSSTSESPYRIKYPAIYSQGCDDWYHGDTLKPCIYGNPKAERTAYLIGDSIGMQWFPALQGIFTAPEWRLIVLTKSSCPMAESSFYYPRLGRTFDECDTWRRRVLEQITRDRPEVVILGSSHSAALDQDGWTGGTDRLLRRITPAARHIFILQSTPVLRFNGAICAGGKSQSMRRFDETRDCTTPAADARRRNISTWIADAASTYPNVGVIDMQDAICPDGLCRAVMDGRLVYRDQQHLDGAFVEALTDRLRKDLASALLPKGEK